MLQQTQVSVVIPYFLKWIKNFPTIEALASASLEHVLKQWEGLGYYSRARHLHEGARTVMDRYQGVLPSDPKKLAEIKGLGPYTQGAIRSFAFKQKAAAIDGNVLRVMSRLFAIEEPIDQSKTRKKMIKLLEAHLPDEEPWLVSEGLIELGATVCKKTPLCHTCPLTKDCLAFRYQKTDVFPKRRERQKTTLLYRDVAVIECQGKIMIQKGQKGKIMADLYEFPYVEKNRDVKEAFEAKLQVHLEYCYALPKQQQAFTRYRVHLFPHFLQAQDVDKRFLWKDRESLNQLPFSSGHRRVLNELLTL